MTVAELIEHLEDMPAEAEVAIAYQPSWPLKARVAEVVASEGDERTVYIAQASAGDDYLERETAEALGWS